MSPRAPHPSRSPRLRVALQRPDPLSWAEHRALIEVAARWGRRAWTTLQVEQVCGLEGMGHYRAWCSVLLIEPDLDQVDLPALRDLLNELLSSVKGARPLVDDPWAVFGIQRRRFVIGAGSSAEPLPADWSPPASSVLAEPRSEARLLPQVELPVTRGQLADLLAILEVEPESSLVDLGLRAGAQHADWLRTLVEDRVQAAGATILLARLAGAGLVDAVAMGRAIAPIALDGDARERDAARSFACLLPEPSQDARGVPGPAPDWSVVASLGRMALEHAELRFAGGGSDSVSSSWLDDIAADDLELEDEEEAEAPDLELLAEQVLSAEVRQRVEGLFASPDFARHCVEALGADDPSATGAALLLDAGLWDGTAQAGSTDALAALVLSGRPWGTRAFALRALAQAGRPDAVDLLIDQSRKATGGLGAEAIRALGRVPGARARQCVRAAMSTPGQVRVALEAMAEAGDVVGFQPAARCTESEDAGVRRTAAVCLDQLGGRRALPYLEQIYLRDRDRGVRLAAASAIARGASLPTVDALLEDTDPEVVVAALEGIRASRRADAWTRCRDATYDRRPEVRRSAALALGGIGLPAATPRLVELLADAHVRCAALDALVECGDSRCVEPVRELAGRGLERALAGRVMSEGRMVRSAPPDSEVMVLGIAPERMSRSAHAAIKRAFADLPLDLRFRLERLEGSCRVDPGDMDTFLALGEALTRADLEVAGIRWSVRDAQNVLRRVGRSWRLWSQGGVTRQAGWFELDAEVEPAERCPLELPSGPTRPVALPPSPEIEVAELTDSLDAERPTVVERPVDLLPEFGDDVPDEPTHVGAAPSQPDDDLVLDDSADERTPWGLSSLVTGPGEDSDADLGLDAVDMPTVAGRAPPGFLSDVTSSGMDDDEDMETISYRRPPPPPLVPVRGAPAPPRVPSASGPSEFEDDPEPTALGAGTPDDPWAMLADPERAEQGLAVLADRGLVADDFARLDRWLNGAEAGYRAVACQVLGLAGTPELVGMVLAQLDHSDARVRCAAASAVGALGNTSHLPPLARLCRDPDTEVRRVALEAIARITRRGGPR